MWGTGGCEREVVFLVQCEDEDMPIVLETNQNHATVKDTEISPTLSASMGMGGGYVPMILEVADMKTSDRCGSEEKMELFDDGNEDLHSPETLAGS